MAGSKFSRQREAIKEYLSHTKEHPTADTVYTNIRSIYPHVSLGTVYRNLNLLAEQGEVMKLNCSDGVVRFDGNPEPHYHFICSKCGSVLDLNMDSIDHINDMAGKDFKGRIEGHTIIFHGNCPECNIS
jgi:Fur family peroxide stress response transcriptional regulator